MTLEEFARELSKLFKFGWLTVDKEGWFSLWIRKSGNEPPMYSEDGWSSYSAATYPLMHIVPEVLKLDLSEYADKDGVIDYSRCIVEVSDVTE